MKVKQRSLNRDYKKRDEILKIKEYSYSIAKFKNLCIFKLKYLIEEGFVNLKETQNNSPSIKEFVEFMEKYPRVQAHGYVTSINREDYRVSIEGLMWEPIKGEPADLKLQRDFLLLCRKADELEVTDFKMRSWWD